MYEIALWLDAGILLRHGFRNRLKCHLLQSMILSLSIIAVKSTIITFTYCSKWNHGNLQDLVLLIDNNGEGTG